MSTPFIPSALPAPTAPFFRDEPATTTGIPTAPQPFKPPSQQEIQSYMTDQRFIAELVEITADTLYAQHHQAHPSDAMPATATT